MSQVPPARVRRGRVDGADRDGKAEGLGQPLGPADVQGVDADQTRQLPALF